jgi:hypothetical protein
VTADLCQSLNALAEETWDHLRWGHQAGFGQPDERAFTDHHLIELLRHHPGQVAAAKFDQNREAETAADAEWWLGDGQRYLGMRLQAKKLDLASASYIELGHHVGQTEGKQLDQLIESASDDGCLAMYVFYNGPPEVEWPVDRCDNEVLAQERRGCTLAMATDVKAILASGAEAIGVEEIAAVSLPWQCLTCCPLAISRDPAQKALEVLGRGGSPTAIATTPRQPPGYVRALAGDDRDLPNDETIPGAATVMAMTLRN